MKISMRRTIAAAISTIACFGAGRGHQPVSVIARAAADGPARHAALRLDAEHWNAQMPCLPAPALIGVTYTEEAMRHA